MNAWVDFHKTLRAWATYIDVRSPDTVSAIRYLLTPSLPVGSNTFSAWSSSSFIRINRIAVGPQGPDGGELYFVHSGYRVGVRLNHSFPSRVFAQVPVVCSPDLSGLALAPAEKVECKSSSRYSITQVGILGGRALPLCLKEVGPLRHQYGYRNGTCVPDRMVPW